VTGAQWPGMIVYPGTSCHIQDGLAWRRCEQKGKGTTYRVGSLDFYLTERVPYPSLARLSVRVALPIRGNLFGTVC
jgi:hypothetical protein